MPLNAFSHYSHGFPHGVTLRGLPILQTHAGNIWWVDSTHANASDSGGNDGTINKPFATIDYAIGRCTSANGDLILVAPGHAETLSTAGAITHDVDGVSIIGLGHGGAQAQLSCSISAAISVSADNWAIKNIRVTATGNALAKGIDVLDGADDGYIGYCRFDQTSTNEFNDAIFCDSADRVLMEHNYFNQGTQAAQSAIHLDDASDSVVIRRNHVQGDYAVACIESEAVAQTMLLIEDNVLINGVTGGLNTIACISLVTATTGFIHGNRLYTAVSAAVTGAIVADGCFMMDNTVSTTAESAPLAAEGNAGGGIVYSVAKTGVADETDETVLWDVTGVVDVYGVVLHVETAVNSEVSIGVEADGPGIDLIATTDVDELIAAGDTQSAASAGGAGVETEVPGDLTPLFAAPVRVSAGAIVLAVAATPGAGVFDGTIFYSPVTAGATVAVE